MFAENMCKKIVYLHTTYNAKSLFEWRNQVRSMDSVLVEIEPAQRLTR